MPDKRGSPSGMPGTGKSEMAKGEGRRVKISRDARKTPFGPRGGTG